MQWRVASLRSSKGSDLYPAIMDVSLDHHWIEARSSVRSKPDDFIAPITFLNAYYWGSDGNFCPNMAIQVPNKKPFALKHDVEKLHRLHRWRTSCFDLFITLYHTNSMFITISGSWEFYNAIECSFSRCLLLSMALQKTTTLFVSFLSISSSRCDP